MASPSWLGSGSCVWISDLAIYAGAMAQWQRARHVSGSLQQLLQYAPDRFRVPAQNQDLSVALF